MSFVVKEWFAERKPDDQGRYIHIRVRDGGVFSFLLSILKIDPTTTLDIDSKSVVLEQGSLKGFAKKVIPLRNITSVYYGYSKPLYEAVIFGVLLAPLTLGISLLIAIIYYALNKQLELGFHSAAGSSSIKFGRSVIEGKKLSEKEIAEVVALISMILTGGKSTPAVKKLAHSEPGKQ